MKNFVKEFKEFALRGNVIDLAIGVIIGGAFKGVIDSFITTIISPILGILFNQNLSYITFSVGNVVFQIGAFITTVISFILTAFVLFLFIKVANKTKKEKEEVAAPVVSEEIELLREIRDQLKK